MGFYGNVSAAQNTTFTFDRIYPNFALMSENCAVDGVYPGRYVLVEYDSDLTIGSRGFMRVFRSGNLYYIDKTRTQQVLYGETNTINTITPGRLAYYTENDDYDGLTTDPGLVTFLICCNTTSDIPGSTPAAFREIVTSDNRPYTINFNVDKNYLQFKKGASEKDIGRGYDSTVWQKLYINGVERYVQIAELNSVVPTFDIGMDAPTGFPTIPHWDTNSTTVYYKVHWQPQWGMRFKSAVQQTGPKFIDDGTPVRDADAVWGSANTEYSTDDTIYPSDEVSTWIRKEYNKTTEQYTYYYYAKKNIEDPGTHQVTSTWDWYTRDQLNADSTLSQDVPAAIYYNAAGFDSEYSHYGSDESMVGAQNGWDGKDRILMAPTGMSGHVYQHHDGTIHKDVAEDIQEFSMMLPSIGDSIAKMWDIVYGDRLQNGYVRNAETGQWILPSGETGFKRNRDIQWDSTRGLRAVTLDESTLGYKYDSDQINTLAGVINSAHDLMGMILVESDAPMNNEETIRNADFGKIYYFTRDQKFCRKHIGYNYSGQTVNDYSWRPVTLTADTWHQNTYYYVDANGDITAPLDGGGTVKLSADRLNAFNNNKTYYAKYIKQFSYTALDHDLIDYAPNTYYTKDPFGNYTLATESSFLVDKNYYTIDPAPEGPLTFDASYEPGRYWYLLNNSYYLDNNEVIDGSRNYVNFTPTKITAYVYGKGLYYYYDGTDYRLDDVNDTAQQDRPYYVRTIQYSDQGEEIGAEFELIGTLGGGKLVSYQPGVYYKRFATTTPAATEGQDPIIHPYEYRVINAVDFMGESASLDYYIIDPETVTPEFLYVPNVYYYKDENTYYLSYQSILSDTAQYYRINPSSVVIAEGFYKPNTYYIWNGTTYVLDSSLTKDHPYNEYFLRDTYYVFNDDLNYYKQGAVWNDVMDMIPSTITLGTRTVVYEMKELPEFARGMNTLHGAILKMAQLMEIGDAQTRDTSTMQGCINYMNDVLDKFGEFTQKEFVIVDNYGRLRSSNWTTSQPITTTNHGKSSNNTTTLPTVENRWIQLYMDDNAANPLVTIKHGFNSVSNTTTVSDKNESLSSHTGLNKGANNVLKLYTPIIDSTGHVVGKNTETVTLPYSFKTFNITNSDATSAALSTDYNNSACANIVADSTLDTLNITAGNRWIRFKSGEVSNVDTLTIAHETHAIDVTDATATDFNASEANNFFTVQDLSFDDAGHVTANKQHSYTLPYGFKTIVGDTSSTAISWTDSTPNANVVAETPTDTLTIANGNKWIRINTNANDDKLTIAHQVNTITTTAVTATNLNTNSTTTIDIPDWTYDEAGHITAKQPHSYTLPYSFKTISPDNTNSWTVKTQPTSNTNVVAELVYDTLKISSGNNWLKVSGTNGGSSGTDTIVIGHAAPDTTAANLTDNDGASASNVTTNSFGSTITIPTFKYDAAGHISSTSSYTVNIPGLSQTTTANATGSGAEVLTEFTYTAPGSGNSYVGDLAAKKRQASSLLLTGYEAPQGAGTSDIAATDSIGGAFLKAQKLIDAAESSISDLEDAVDLLNGTATQAGSVAKAIKDAINALDGSTATDTSTTTHVFVTSVTQTNGKISVKTRAITKDDLPALAAADIPALDYISSTTKPTDVVASSSGGTTTNYSDKTYIEIIKDLASRLAALEDSGS